MEPSTYPYCSEFKTTDSAQSLSVLSWNLIFPAFAEDFPEDYPYASPDDLAWAQRLPKIKRKLAHANADIVCVQEIDKRSFADDIGHEFEQRHGYKFKVNMGTKKSKVDFTTGVLFKASKLECQYEDPRARALILLLSNKLEQEQCARCAPPNQKRPCLLHSFFLVNVHLDSPREDANNDHVRDNQIKSILKRIKFCVTDKLKRNLSDAGVAANVRIMIVGDFNSGHDCSTAQMLLGKSDAYSHPYTFKDAYFERMAASDMRKEAQRHSLDSSDPNVHIRAFPTFASMDRVYTIDMLFYTHNNFALKAVSETMDERVREAVKWDEATAKRIREWLEKDKKTNKNGQLHLADFDSLLGLPNQQIPSDHMPIAAVFEMQNLCTARDASEPCACCVELKKKGKQKKKNKKRANRAVKAIDRALRFLQHANLQNT